MRAVKTEFTIFTAEGVSFTAEASNLPAALKKSAAHTKDYRIVAVVESDSLVTPAPGKLTALIVRNPTRSV